MADSADRPDDPKVRSTPALPDVYSPPKEDVLDDVPSTDEIIKQADTVEKIVEQQPDVDELLHRHS